MNKKNNNIIQDLEKILGNKRKQVVYIVTPEKVEEYFDFFISEINTSHKTRNIRENKKEFEDDFVYSKYQDEIVLSDIWNGKISKIRKFENIIVEFVITDFESDRTDIYGEGDDRKQIIYIPLEKGWPMFTKKGCKKLKLIIYSAKWKRKTISSDICGDIEVFDIDENEGLYLSKSIPFSEFDEKKEEIVRWKYRKDELWDFEDEKYNEMFIIEKLEELK